ncbi:MAG: hypothetical protein PHX20_00480 [Candidatus Omnitrophica bacterium]|nr:hypothetical protein [Candidatus Omnitrophota bacterium]
MAICPECGAHFIVRGGRTGFKKLIVSRKNQKVAQSLLTVSWLAVSVAGTFYGIPLPPPPISADTFAPYRTPFRIRCLKARKAADAIPYSEGLLLAGSDGYYKSLYADRWLSNPYDKELRPYSVVINEFSSPGSRLEISIGKNDMGGYR